MRYGPPNRVWFRHADGKWSSREWKPGEKERYAAAVGHQLVEPTVSNDLLASILKKAKTS